MSSSIGSSDLAPGRWTGTGAARRWLLCVALVLTASRPGQAQIRREFDLRVRMRDGIALSADIWRPEQSGRYPVLLVRTPYLKTMPEFDAPSIAGYFAQRGYGFVVEDVRGRGDSQGAFHFFSDDGRDGYDTIEWIARQPWSNGRVCMIGLSYLATVQWMAARERPPHLVCLTSTAPAGRYFDELPYQGGAFEMAWAINWFNGQSARVKQDANAAGIDRNRVFQHRPLISMDSAFGRRMPLFRELLRHPTWDDHWRRIFLEPRDFAAIHLPVLHVTGWFDGDQPGAIHYWSGMAANSRSAADQYLLIGPWDHEQTFFGGKPTMGAMNLSSESIVDVRALHLAFFERYLKQDSSRFALPRARVFLTGANVWRDFDHYPPIESRAQQMYLRSRGKANTLHGDGSLSVVPPADEPADGFVFDPHAPVPDSLRPDQGDQRRVEERNDVLVYTSEVLEEPVTVLGRVFVTVVAASDAKDTDFTAVLADVDASGAAIQLGCRVGIIRARYRQGYDRERLLTPGRPERYRIELFDIGHVFLVGHRIRLEISSSNYPTFNPNQNTGHPVATDTAWRVARQTVFHDARHPSFLTLPVLTRPPE